MLLRNAKVLVLTSAVVMLVGCGGDAITMTATAMDYETIRDMPAEIQQQVKDAAANAEAMVREADEARKTSETDSSGSSANSAASAYISDPSDPLDLLRVSEDDITEIVVQYDSSAFIVRGDKIYSLNAIPVEKAEANNVGYCLTQDSKVAALYQGTDRQRVSMGDIPIPKLEPGDEVRYYSTVSKDTMAIPAEVVGTTFKHFGPAVGGTALVLDMYNIYNLLVDKYIEVTDEAGNEVPINDLTFGEKYVVSWPEGSTLKTLDVVADSHYIRYNKYNFKPVKGEATKDGYSILDMSVLEPGLYHMAGGLIEIP